MRSFRAFFHAAAGAVVDALFPLSEAEEALAALSPEDAVRALASAPPYDGSVAALPSGTRSLFAYADERASRLVWAIKYKKSAHAVSIGGYALWRALLQTGGSGAARAPDVIAPIPILNRRRRERGYNQCELLLDEIQRLDADRAFRCEKGLLARSKHTNRQTMKGRGERIESATGIFSVDATVALRCAGARIVVIDDVITTGSTMKAALDALSAAGFDDAVGLSLAH